MARASGRRSVVLSLLALLAAGPALAAAKAPAPLPDDMSMGSPRAKVTLIEYASVACPHCARFNNDVFPAIKKRYIDTGKVRYTLREYLTDPVQLAAAGFMLARCTGAKHYFKTVDAVFHGQAEIYSTGKILPTLNRIGAASGLSEAQVKACITDQAAADALEARVQGYADKDGIDSTPTFLIGDKKLVGEQTLADIEAALDAALKQKG